MRVRAHRRAEQFEPSDQQQRFSTDTVHNPALVIYSSTTVCYNCPRKIVKRADLKNGG
jgi:hypothetical protein